MSSVSLITICSIKITARREYADGTRIGSAVASGFTWRHNGQLYLITNWHNVTGMNPDTGKANGSFSPTHFTCEAKVLGKGGNTVAKYKFDLELYNENEDAIWNEHPKDKAVDVVAIPLKPGLPETHEFVALNEQDFEQNWQPRIGEDGFIVGYPEGFAGGQDTPIWKRASIASEPSLDFDGKPVFLMDTVGNSGMSGSPVIGRGTGILKMNASSVQMSGLDKIGTWEKFIGVYAGRMSKQGIGSQLGRVWKASTVDEIFGQCSAMNSSNIYLKSRPHHHPHGIRTPDP